MALRDRIAKALKPADSTPTRQNTGTSYVAKGAPGVTDPGAKPAQLTELGSQRASTINDPVPQLGTAAQAIRTYTSMVRDDVSVRVSLRAGKAPVLGAEWYIEPFSDNADDLVIAEFVEFNLFNGMTTPWSKSLEQILKMFEHGFSVFEPVWELREWAPRQNATGANRKQYTMLRKLAVRPSSTINKFNYDDNGGPVSVEHTAIDADNKTKTITIPIEKLVVFTFDQDGGDLKGNSILRSAYRNWYYKDYMYRIDGIQKERHGIGVPDIELQPGYSKEDKDFAHTLGSNLRTNERAYVVRTTMLKVGFAELSGLLVEPLQSAEHHDTMIMKNIMVQFLNMGTGVMGGSGGRATGATSMDMFLKSMRHIADGICDSMNTYAIPNLVAYNFPTDRFPQLKVRGVGETKDLQMWSAAMRNLLNVNAITVDEATEQWIRQQMDMPKLTSEWVDPKTRPEQVVESGNPTDYANNNGKATDKSNNGGAGNVGAPNNSGST